MKDEGQVSDIAEVSKCDVCSLSGRIRQMQADPSNMPDAHTVVKLMEDDVPGNGLSEPLRSHTVHVLSV